MLIPNMIFLKVSYVHIFVVDMSWKVNKFQKESD